jgi:hypothetical protein
LLNDLPLLLRELPPQPCSTVTGISNKHPADGSTPAGLNHTVCAPDAVLTTTGCDSGTDDRRSLVNLPIGAFSHAFAALAGQRGDPRPYFSTNGRVEMPHNAG